MTVQEYEGVSGYVVEHVSNPDIGTMNQADTTIQIPLNIYSLLHPRKTTPLSSTIPSFKSTIRAPGPHHTKKKKKKKKKTKKKKKSSKVRKETGTSSLPTHIIRHYKPSSAKMNEKKPATPDPCTRTITFQITNQEGILIQWQELYQHTANKAPVHKSSNRTKIAACINGILHPAHQISRP